MGQLPITKQMLPRFVATYTDREGMKSTRSYTRYANALKWLGFRIAKDAFGDDEDYWLQPELFLLIANRLKETNDLETVRQWALEQVESGAFAQYVGVSYRGININHELDEIPF